MEPTLPVVNALLPLLYAGLVGTYAALLLRDAPWARRLGPRLLIATLVVHALYIAGEQGLLLRSTDDGEIFTHVESPSKGTYFGLLNGKNGELLVYGLRGRAFLSVDGAASWTEVTTQTNASISAGARYHDGTIVLASQAGELLVSRNDGRTFEKAPQGGGSAITGLVESPAGGVVASTLRGIHKVEMPAIAH